MFSYGDLEDLNGHCGSQKSRTAHQSRNLGPGAFDTLQSARSTAHALVDPVWGGAPHEDHKGGTDKGEAANEDFSLCKNVYVSFSLYMHITCTYMNIYIYIYIICADRDTRQRDKDKAKAEVQGRGTKPTSTPAPTRTPILCLSLYIYIYIYI